jgi:hypothetical protein
METEYAKPADQSRPRRLNAVRTVTENSRTLKFDTQGFESGSRRHQIHAPYAPSSTDTLEAQSCSCEIQAGAHTWNWSTGRLSVTAMYSPVIFRVWRSSGEAHRVLCGRKIHGKARWRAFWRGGIPGARRHPRPPAHM